MNPPAGRLRFAISLAVIVCALIPIRTHTVAFGLGEANVALQMLKHDEIKGAAVLRVS